MLDKKDTFTRWYQGSFGVVVFFISVYLTAYEIHYFLHPLSSSYPGIRYRDLLGILGFGGFFFLFAAFGTQSREKTTSIGAISEP
jgi:hypothetical protein